MSTSFPLVSEYFLNHINNSSDNVIRSVKPKNKIKKRSPIKTPVILDFMKSTRSSVTSPLFNKIKCNNSTIDSFKSNYFTESQILEISSSPKRDDSSDLNQNSITSPREDCFLKAERISSQKKLIKNNNSSTNIIKNGDSNDKSPSRTSIKNITADDRKKINRKLSMNTIKNIYLSKHKLSRVTRSESAKNEQIKAKMPVNILVGSTKERELNVQIKNSNVYESKKLDKANHNSTSNSNRIEDFDALKKQIGDYLSTVTELNDELRKNMLSELVKIVENFSQPKNEEIVVKIVSKNKQSLKSIPACVKNLKSKFDGSKEQNSGKTPYKFIPISGKMTTILNEKEGSGKLVESFKDGSIKHYDNEGNLVKVIRPPLR